VDGLVFDTIRGYVGDKRLTIIGTDGAQGSGKSWFQQELQQALQAFVIETDDFLPPRDKREFITPTFFEEHESYRRFYDFRRMGEVFAQLRRGDPMTIEGLYNRNDDGRCTKTLEYKGERIIILGGPFIYQPELPEPDFSILLCVDEEYRWQNVATRTLGLNCRPLEQQKAIFDGSENWYRYYYGRFNPKYALLIDNTHFDNRWVKEDRIANPHLRDQAYEYARSRNY
jgi:uridine kinase